MIWWLACAAPAPPLPDDWGAPQGTEAGRYTVQIARGALRIRSATGPVVDAMVTVHVPADLLR